MNKDRLNKLISIYIDKFDMINNDEHDENMKWKAVYHSKNSKFIVTMAFINGFLTSEDQTIINRCRQLEASISACEKLEKAIKSRQAELDTLIARLK